MAVHFCKALIWANGVSLSPGGTLVEENIGAIKGKEGWSNSYRKYRRDGKKWKKKESEQDEKWDEGWERQAKYANKEEKKRNKDKSLSGVSYAYPTKLIFSSES